MTHDLSVADQIAWESLTAEEQALARRAVRVELEDTIEEAIAEGVKDAKYSVEGRMNDLKRAMRADLDKLREYALEIIAPQTEDQMATAKLYWQLYAKIGDRCRVNQ